MNFSEIKSALLVLDMQTAIIRHLPVYNELSSNVAKAISNARSKGIPVIYAMVQFRTDMPEVSMYNKMFAASKERAAAMKGTTVNMSIDESIEPLQNEIIVSKRRVSAFTGSDLEVVLRSQGIQHLILSGFATSGVVLSTLREAADKDYLLTVLSDCCADYDSNIHSMLIEKVFPEQSTVTGASQFFGDIK